MPNIVSSKGYPLLLRNLLVYGPFRFTAYGCSVAESTSPNLCLSSHLANESLHQRIHRQCRMTHLFQVGQNLFLVGCHALVGDLVDQVGITGSNGGFL